MSTLPTDEKIEKKLPRERDMDAHMLFGCSGFVFASFATYALSVWPFFVWMDVQIAATLWLALGLGLPPAFALGVVSAFKFGIAGAAGFIGGMVSGSIFLYLRFEQVFLEADTQRIPPPDYPVWFQWLIPMLTLGFAIVAAAAVIVFFPGRGDQAK